MASRIATFLASLNHQLVLSKNAAIMKCSPLAEVPAHNAKKDMTLLSRL